MSVNGSHSAKPKDRTDQRAEVALGALASAVLLLIGFMIVFVFSKAWPSFAHNGLAGFAPGANVDEQLANIFNPPANPSAYVYTLHAWPLLYATALITTVSVAAALLFSVLAALCLLEVYPPGLRRLLEPVVRLLAAVPSVIYGLIGVLVLVPFVGSQLISASQKS